MGLKSGFGDDPASSESDVEASEDEPVGSQEQPYIVRRMQEGASAQFERGTRLNFFVHDDIARGEKRLRSNMDERLKPEVTKYDLREAVYRAAMANEDDVTAELLEMGYVESD